MSTLTRVFACAALVGASMALFGTGASAVHDDTGGLQLDGDIAASTSGNYATTNAGTYDWDSFFCAQDAAQTACPAPAGVTATTGDISVKPGALPAGFISSGLADTPVPGIPPTATSDYALPDHTTFTTGSKDTLPIGPDPSTSKNWQCASSNNLGAKDDLLNAYGVAFRPASGPQAGDLIVYFGAEKSSDLGDNNIGLWILKDPTVGCTSSKGAVSFGGQHTDGDILLTAAFTNGGGTATVNAFKWHGGGSGSLDATAFASSNECPDPAAATLPAGFNDALCAITNLSPVNPPWTSTSVAKTTATATNGTLGLASQEFYEGGVDLTALGDAGCFNRFLVDTRSSQSPTATIFDYALGTLPTCGSLTVKKYIDADASGTLNTGDVTTGTPVANWSFTVNGPATSGGTGPQICSGTTIATDGSLTCTTGSLRNLSPGTYTITETQKTSGSPSGTGFYNTDPGPGVNTSTTVTKTVVMAAGNQTVEFGNTCFVKKTFQVDNVPTGQPNLFVDYTANGGTTHHIVRLTTVGSTASASVSTFVQGDSITWSWGEYDATNTTPDTTHEVAGATSESLSGGAYPSCAVLNEVQFPSATVTGTKYKDANANGVQDSNEGPPTQAFSFELLSGGTQVGSTVQSSTTAVGVIPAGTFSFTGVAPGTYTIHELSKTGWVQTQPSSGDITVVVHLGDTSVTKDSSGNNILFGNTPLTDLNISVTPETNPAVTHAQSISCTNVTGTQTNNSYGATGLKDGTYNCTVVIADP